MNQLQTVHLRSPAIPPLLHHQGHFIEIMAHFGEQIFVSGRVLQILSLLKNPVVEQEQQAFGKAATGYFDLLPKLFKSACAKKSLTQDKKGPAIAQNLGGAVQYKPVIIRGFGHHAAKLPSKSKNGIDIV
jgi:hypothetical protein